jgi:hypothetical protein
MTAPTSSSATLQVNEYRGSSLRALGLDRDIPFVEVGALHEVRSPVFEKPFVMPHGLDAALAATKAHFPQQARGVEQYFERIDAVRQAVTLMSEHQVAEAEGFDAGHEGAS